MIPCSYAILFTASQFTTPPVISTTGCVCMCVCACVCVFCFGSVSLFFLMLFLHSSPAAYWAPINLGSSSFIVFFFFFAFSYCLWGSQGKNTEVVCHSLLQGSRGPRFVRTHHHQSLRLQLHSNQSGGWERAAPVDSPWNYTLSTRVHQSFSAKLPRWLRW